VAPTKIVRRTKRAFQRRERLFRREIIKTIAKESRCYICKRKGEKILYWINTKKWMDGLFDIVILKWRMTCWKCGRETPVVWRATVSRGWDKERRGIAIEDNEQWYQDVEPRKSFLIKASKIFPFVRRVYSRTLERFVYGNCCIHCGAYQGNYYVSEDFSDILWYGEWGEWDEIWRKPERKRLKAKEAVQYFGEERVKEYDEGVKLHTHHISYNPEITIKVCPACHNRIHHTDKYPHLKPLDRRPDSKKRQKGGDVS